MIDTLTHFKDPKYLPVEEALEQLKAYKPAIIENHPTNQVQNLGFSIDELEEKYRLHNVRYHDGLYRVDIDKKWMNNGELHTQDEWAEISSTMPKSMPNTKLMYACLKEILYSRDDPLNNRIMENIFWPDLYKNAFTSTRIKYTPQGRDIVFHDFGRQGGGFTVIESVSGFSGEITELGSIDNILFTLLGTNNIGEIMAVLARASDKAQFWLYRKLKPQVESLSAVQLCIYPDKIDINCDFAITNRKPARFYQIEPIIYTK
jgi:hypothetical protein